MKGLPHSPIALPIARLITTVVTLAYVVIIARELGPEGRGVTATIVALSVLLPSLAGLGLPLAVRRRAKQDAADLAFSDAVRVLFWTSPVVVLLGGTTALLFRPLLTTAEFFATLTLFCASQLGVLRRVLEQLLIARENYFFQAISMLSLSFGIAGAIGVSQLFFDVTVLSVVVSQLVGLLFSSGVAFALASPRWVAKRTGHSLLQESKSYWVRDALRSARERADQLVVLPLLGPFSAGVYSVALAIASIPLIFGHTLGVMAFHRVKEGQSGVSGFLNSALRIGSLLTVFMAIPIGLIAGLLVPELLGREFSASVPLILVMLLSLVPSFLCLAVMEGALNALKKGPQMAFGEGIVIGTGSLFAFFLTDSLREYGVVLGFTVGAVAALFYWGRELGVGPRLCRMRSADWYLLRAMVVKPR